MARYTVHVPRLAADRREALERAVFVREGWSWGAFIFGPLWLLWHRHWVTGFGVLVAYGVLVAGLDALPLHDTATGVSHLLLSLLFGLEGASLRRFALAKAGYAEVGLVAGAQRDEMERRFFAVIAADVPPAIVSASGVPVINSGAIIGLFPQARHS